MRHTTGDRDTMDAILATVDPLSVQNLILAHCAELHVPNAIQKLRYLSMIKLYNSTIATWDTQAALLQAHHSQLQVMYLARVNASDVPVGMLANDFPSTVWAIQLCITNISALPQEIKTVWRNVGIIGYEGNHQLTEFPDMLTVPPNVFVLSLGMNSIANIPDGLLSTHAFVGISMNGNPIDRLPDSVGSFGMLTFLNFSISRSGRSRNRG